jgi:hypothetical protein
MGIKRTRGSAAVDIIIGTAIIIFVILPIFSFIAEKYIIIVKTGAIKDAIDISCISAYNAIIPADASMNMIKFDNAVLEDKFRELLRENLLLDEEMEPLEGSVAAGKVTITSIAAINSGFPCSCPEGTLLSRPSVHCCVVVPVEPSLYRQFLADILGGRSVDLYIHQDTDIPVNN